MTEKPNKHTSRATEYHYQLIRKEADSWSFLAVKPGESTDEFVAVIRFGAPRPTRKAPPGVWDIYSLHVRRGYRGQGLASALHRLAVEHALAHGKALRVLHPPAKGYPEVWQRLREQRVDLEGGERIDLKGVSATDKGEP